MQKLHRDTQDPRQENTILKIQQVYDELKQLYPDSGKRSGLTLHDALPVESKASAWFGGWFGSGSRSESTDAADAERPKGLYMYGGVGVGKTMLMDLLVQVAPPRFKLERTHYHDFMLDVHGKLRHYQKTQDPLSFVADEITDSTRVLCLDEFFVTDVADAMILHRLFGRLWDRRLVLVATSNRHPDSLYEGGLQRNLFLPFIARLKEECIVHDMNSKTDYRRLASHHKGLYFVTPSRDEDLYRRFVDLAEGHPVEKKYVGVAMGRQLEVPRAAGDVALFDFKELCDRPLAAADYIALAKSFHTVALTGVPVFTAANRTSAYRFVTLIDVFYEHRTRVLMSAEAMPFELFENIMNNQDAREANEAAGQRGSRYGSNENMVVDDNLGFSKDRAISRLTEMQSKEYLIAHAKQHAPDLLRDLDEQYSFKK
ncbi:hypothetical protein N2152v2_004360 [Parachlorella kessleri]